ncbi:MAG: response regulator [Opitutaceae bacterium]|nr:response regulator [Opitutaceae bacterium]
MEQSNGFFSSARPQAGDTPRVLKVLLVEDSALDEELVLRELKQQGFAVAHHRVKSREATERALEEGGWELILADCQMPGFSGLEALELVQARAQDVPFILVSGSMNDRAAVEAMRAGAHDFIEKDHLVRLGPAVERELREADVRRELRRTLQALRESAERLRLAASASNIGLWDWNLTTGEVFYSPEWKAQLGYKDQELPCAFAAWEQRLHPEDHGQTMAKVRAHVANPAGRYEAEFRLRHRDGSWRWIRSIGQVLRDDAGRPARMLGSHQDITEAKRLEADFLRAQRVESIGTLAGGVAHDLNNILAPILMGSELLREVMPDAAAGQILGTMESCARRGADLVKQLLTFARGCDGQRVLLQPRHLLRELVTLLPGLLPKTCELKASFPHDLWVVEGDATQFHQVLLNLCVNARDAMPHGGRLTLSAVNVRIDEAFASMQPGARPGPHVAFVVTDTGGGIPADILPRIFEPFFTTKEPGRGTGLGLATVQTIARSHGGFVQVQSTVGHGTIFKVFLPAQPDTSVAEPEAGPDRNSRGSGEQVLVVEDDELLREMLQRCLEANGYRVIAAADGTEGLTRFLQHRTEIRVVVTDVMMPHLDGIALVRALRRLEPAVPIVACSGADLSEEAKGPRCALGALGVNAFLQKPYRTESLLRLVREVLVAGPMGAAFAASSAKNNMPERELRLGGDPAGVACAHAGDREGGRR